jgi:type IV pilus assembly protein PilN
MIRINLISTEKTRKKVKSDTSVVELAVILLLIGIGGVGIFFWYSTVQDRIDNAKRLVNKEKQAIQQLPDAIKQFDEYKKKRALLEQQLGVIEKLKNSKQGPVRVLDEISMRIPKQVWLTSVQQRDAKLVISGEAETNEAVAIFFKRLQDSPYFKEVELQHIVRMEKSGIGDQKIMQITQFNLSCIAIFSAS